MQLEQIFPHLVHVGSLLYLVCFLFRDQILLRSFAIAGDLAYVAYYFTVTDQPLWSAILWNIPTVLINVAMIAIILRDSKMTNFSENDLKLYRRLNEIAPGDFRKLMRAGTWHKASSEQILARENQPLDTLYYVMEGAIDMEKNNRKIVVKPGIFIGEIAYLKKTPATATVRVLPGTLFVAWQHDDIAKATARNDGLKTAIGAVLNSDLADKLART